MRIRFTLAAAAALAVLSACGTPTITDTADQEAAISKPEGTTQAQPAEKKAEPAVIGSTITLTGTDGEKVAVKLARVFPRAQSAVDGIEPDAGKRFYGVELVLKNTGDKPYEDAPSNGVAIIDAEGQQFSSTIVDLKDGVPLNGTVTIAPGDVRKGVVAFEVPQDAVITKLQFALNSGFSDQKAEWLIKKQ